jgi:hypothetical protein
MTQCKPAMSPLATAQALENSPFGMALRQSNYAFPLLIMFHLLGLLLAAGTVIFWDLRLLGIGLRMVSVSQVGRSLLPWTWAGFTVMFCSGALLVCTESGLLYGSFFFRLKILLLLLAGLNVLIFHMTIYRTVNGWNLDKITPWRARLAGAASLLLWFSILAAGRSIGYTIDYSK